MDNLPWPYFDPDYEILSDIINPPRVVLDNDSDDNVSLLKIDSANRPGTLLEVVQVLTDLELNILKAYISSDGGWFMDVFHVTDEFGNKIRDERLLSFVSQCLGTKRSNASSSNKKSSSCQSGDNGTVIELTGTDRPGLLSEVLAVINDLGCNVTKAQVWTHNSRMACLISLSDELMGGPIVDPAKLSLVREHLCMLIRGSSGDDGAQVEYSAGLTHSARRLHQIMLANRDYDGAEIETKNKEIEKEEEEVGSRPRIAIETCAEKGYSVIHIICKDRPKLLFDTVCTLTDMQFIVFHASIRAEGQDAIQEFFVRHLDGCIVNTISEKKQMTKYLEAAILRRVCEGLRLEVCMRNKKGLLSQITRILRETGLSVMQADVLTQGEEATGVFYVTDASGGSVGKEVLDAMRDKMMGQSVSHVEVTEPVKPCTSTPPSSFGHLLKTRWERFSLNWSLIGS